MGNAACHRWMQEFHTARFLQDLATQCFSEVMVKQLLAGAIRRDSAAYHPRRKESHTARFLQEIATQFSLEVMEAVACGSNLNGKCNIPPLDEGISYSQVSAGVYHTVLLRSDGQAVACGSNSNGQCSIPPLDSGLSFSQVSAGQSHTVLLRSDGQAVACGLNSNGQCNIPPLEEGFSYIWVSAGQWHTMLLRSDGQAVACGSNSNGQCNIPSLRSWGDLLPFGFASPSYRYVCDFTIFPVLGKDRVVQVDFLLEHDAGVILTCVGLDGLEVLRLKAKKSDRTVDVCSRMARELNTHTQNLRMILPDARLLGTICKANPLATLSDVISA